MPSVVQCWPSFALRTPSLSTGGYIVRGFRNSRSEGFQKFPSEGFRKFPSEGGLKIERCTTLARLCRVLVFAAAML